MVILEDSVLPEHVKMVRDTIKNAKGWRRTVHPLIRKCKGVLREITIYFLLDDVGKPIAWVYLHKRQGWAASEIHQVFVEPEFRRMGFAYLLYTTIIHDGVLLSSGPSHTTGSMSVWSKLACDPAFTVWAHDFYNLKRTAEVISDGKKMECSLRIYDDSGDDIVTGKQIGRAHV